MSKVDIAWLSDRPVAHRGLHSENEGIPENSIPAFENAIKHNYAIELDVFVTRDSQVIVFHDEHLKRMCKYDKSIFAIDSDNRKFYKLLNSNEEIPLLSNVLNLVKGRVPVIIHVRESKHYWCKRGKIVAEVSEVFRYYEGPLAIQSFDPFILYLFAQKAPNVIRGQIASGFENENLGSFTKFLLSNYKLNWLSKPHYLAHSITDAYKRLDLFQKLRKKGLLILGWTVENVEVQKQVMEYCDNIIFEGYLP